MPSVHGQAKVGQDGQEKTAEGQATRSLCDEATHSPTILQLRWSNHKIRARIRLQ
jgi:hypothetical protein